MGTFDESLSTYVEKLFEKRKVKFLTNAAVAKVVGNTVILNSGQKIPFGACVWSTGNTALDFVRELGLPLSKDARIKIDEKLQVQTTDGKYTTVQCFSQIFPVLLCTLEGKKIASVKLFFIGKKCAELGVVHKLRLQEEGVGSPKMATFCQRL